MNMHKIPQWNMDPQQISIIFTNKIKYDKFR